MLFYVKALLVVAMCKKHAVYCLVGFWGPRVWWQPLLDDAVNGFRVVTGLVLVGLGVVDVGAKV